MSAKEEKRSLDTEKKNDWLNAFESKVVPCTQVSVELFCGPEPECSQP